MLENTMSTMSNSSKTSPTILPENIAVNRFGYGARGDELTQAKNNPQQWVKAQLQPLTFSALLPSSKEISHKLAEIQLAKKEAKKGDKKDEAAIKEDSKYPRSVLRAYAAESLIQAVSSNYSVSWRLMDFFSNHFSVTATGPVVTALAGTLESEAIAPNLFGNFDELLLAVIKHPAMLIYLNNEKSFGPNSKLGKKGKGLNENLAREILELHTLGVNGGYQQSDVLALAHGITGWSVINPRKEKGAGFIFRENGHQSGSQTLLTKKYSEKGIEQGEDMLKNLAMNPATAKHVCYKLAHHFVSEKPSKTLLNAMEKTWLSSQGNIKQVMETLFESPDAWLASPEKFKTPREFVISANRALSNKAFGENQLIKSLITLGQQPFRAGSPAGFSDEQKDWLGASALMARIDWAALVSQYRQSKNAVNVMSLALGDSVSKHTKQMVSRAESDQQALTLLLMSPDFLWR